MNYFTQFLTRLTQHLVHGPLRLFRCCTSQHKSRISEEIRRSESLHRAQIVVAVEDKLSLWELLRGITPHQKAQSHFVNLRIWDTEENCGVLVYILLADRAIEIIADRGLHKGSVRFDHLCEKAIPLFLLGQYGDGVSTLLAALSEELAKVFPHASDNYQNELSDEIRVL
jgi:uncharacterized membrane protein